jgi:probable rRNA maturation factor
LTVHAQLGARYVPFLRRNLRRATGMITPNLRELSVALVNDRRMSELHLQFMNLPGPTDVLTFPLEAQGRRVTAGEVVVCVPEARRRAAEHGTRIEHELLLYAIHGMLHLCGFDDRTPDRYQAMHRKEDQILTKLGIGPVFSPKADVSAAARGRGRRRG